MISQVHARWSRLSQMSWDEMQTRLRQEMNKRVDWAVYSAGLNPSRNGVSAGAEISGQFFFKPEEVQGRVTLLKKYLPDAVETILQDADGICQHHFHLLGYPDLDYSREIDWHLDAVHGKRAPLQPWFQIRFLDFSQVGDHKIIWELNRLQHFVTLAKACVLSGEQRYRNELIRQWSSWQNANPYPLGINWASSLEVAFRSLSWLWVLQILGAEIPANFRHDLKQALARNGWYIERYLSTYFSPNTHLLGEAVALLFLGTLCPEFRESKRWREKGWRIVTDESQRQVRPDGVYFEQSLYYHVYALDFFLYARCLASCNGIEIPPEFDSTLKKMLDVLRTLAQAGRIEGFGDDDGGRVFDPHRNRAEHMTDPLATGAVLFQNDDYSSAARLTEESIWLFGETATEILRSTAGVARKPESKRFPSGGIYAIAAAEPRRQLMMIDAGPQGTGRSGHGHADALSIRFSADGRRRLIDPGTYSYVESDERTAFRGTGAHNTLRVDGVDQAIEDGPFAWSSIPQARIESWIEGETFTLFSASHDGYQRLMDPVTHRRQVVQVRDFWLVRDAVIGRGQHGLEIFWHFAPEMSVEPSDEIFLARPADDSEMQLELLPAKNSGWACEMIEGSFSPAYGSKLEAALLRCKIHTHMPAECATLLVPSIGQRPSRGIFYAVSTPAVNDKGNVKAYCYRRSEESSYMIFCDCAGGWRAGPWESDGRFLFCHVQSNRVTQVVSCGASFIKFNSAVVFKTTTPVERWEWMQGTDGAEVFSSDSVLAGTSAEHVFERGNASFEPRQ